MDSCQQCHTRIPEHQESEGGLLSTLSGYRKTKSQGVDPCQQCHTRIPEHQVSGSGLLLTFSGYRQNRSQGVDPCQQCHTRIPEHQVSGSGLLSTFSGYRQNRSQGVDSCPHCHMTPKHKDYAASHRMQEHQPESQPPPSPSQDTGTPRVRQQTSVNTLS